MNATATGVLVLADAERPPNGVDLRGEERYLPVCFTNHCRAEYASDQLLASMEKSTNRFQRAESALAGLGARLRQVRGKRTQEDFAAVLGVPRQQYARYEKGRVPDPLHLVHIALELNLSLDELLTGTTAQRKGQRGVARDPQAATPSSAFSDPTEPGMALEQRKLWDQVMRVYRNRRTDKVAEKTYETMMSLLSTYALARPEEREKAAEGATGG
ncbi:MAG TPA: helix-turn-helix transcriptional regulator [Terriglobales bacterium]|nr:helix-turn-helix transcriptional regulator [Terriglobales bacterium]